MIYIYIYNISIRNGMKQSYFIWMLIFFKNEIDKETSLVELYLYIECS